MEWCLNEIHAKGHCNKHYHQLKRHGRIFKERERRHYGINAVCEVVWCDRNPQSRGLCKKHYRQEIAYGGIRKTRFDPNEIVLLKNHVEVVLKNGSGKEVGRALIDKENFGSIKQYHWSYDKDGYAVTCKNGKRILMHRLIMDIKSRKKDVDHINHDRLDNRKSNLRICSRSQNNMNHRVRRDSSTGVKGVTWNKFKQKWEVRIYVNKKKIYLGCHDDFNYAISLRKNAEKKYFGEYAYDPEKDVINK